MRTDGPSLTARGVAAERLLLDRPSTPTGDTDADARLARSLLDGWDTGAPSRAATGITSWVAHRTRFLDDVVLTALGDGITQVVIAGAGYDARALRFRTPGVQFFEVDHPLTQADKRARLDAVGARSDDITFVAVDFVDGDVTAALAAAGHDAGRPTLFLCEGVLRYLPEHAWRGLLGALAHAAAPSSTLGVTISTRDPGDEDDVTRARREANDHALDTIGEQVLTVPPWRVAERWLRDAGWVIETRVDVGAGRNLVCAVAA